MAGFGQSSRRSGFGGNSRGPSAPTRAAASVPSQGERGGRGDKPRSAWTTVTALYDPYHSSMEPQIVSEFYRTAFCIKLAPVFAERRGPDDGGSGKKYDHDNAAMIVLDLNEVIVFRHQLDSFINGQLTEVVLPRLETKRLILAPAEQYYDASHPEYSVHANGLVLEIAEDASDRSDAKSVVFISQQKTVQLQDFADEERTVPAEPVAFYPELQALLAAMDSFITNCARVDFSSCRLLEQRGGGEERPAGPTATMPTRRTGGLGAPAPRGTATEGSAASSGPARTGGVTQTNSVSDGDIDAALGGGEANLDDVLGDAPKF